MPQRGDKRPVLIVTALLLVLFALFFGRTLLGKALRACSSNRIGLDARSCTSTITVTATSMAQSFLRACAIPTGDSSSSRVNSTLLRMARTMCRGGAATGC